MFPCLQIPTERLRIVLQDPRSTSRALNDLSRSIHHCLAKRSHSRLPHRYYHPQRGPVTSRHELYLVAGGFQLNQHPVTETQQQGVSTSRKARDSHIERVEGGKEVWGVGGEGGATGG